MKREATASQSAFIRLLGVMGLVIAGVLVWFVARHDRGSEKISVAPTHSSASLAAATNTTPAVVVPPAATNIPSLKQAVEQRDVRHPFKAARTSGAYEWTAEDGKDTNVIRQLAHNELEYQRMVIENNGIYVRQLVYHTEPFVLQAQQAVQSGQSIQQITLPGLDGQELHAVVTQTDMKDGGSQGIFYGKLPGDPNSFVTVAFINDREAFMVNSPQDQIYLVGEAREPGEIVVKSINPATYGRPVN
jgi:hypothetical protein